MFFFRYAPYNPMVSFLKGLYLNGVQVIIVNYYCTNQEKVISQVFLIRVGFLYEI
jgi:hypothetical protein